MFPFADIKAAGDCIAYCITELRMHPTKQNGNEARFNCPWRPDSDSGSFAVTKTGWYDHVEKEGGDIIGLVARARFGGDIFQAQEHLGEYYGMKPTISAKKAKKFVCAYDYVALDGTLMHQTVRFDPKEFVQRRPDPDPDHDGQWIWNLEDIEPVLYRLPEWHNSSWVCVVEGEKDADNLSALGIPATTNAMGAKNWRPSYSEALAGKHIALIPDNDDPGRAHAALVASHLRNHAGQIKIVTLPDLPPKGDVSDWIAAGGTKAQLIELIKSAQPIDQAAITEPVSAEAQHSVAKRANKHQFTNYTVEEVRDAAGEKREEKTAIQINDLVADVHRRFWDFPRRVGTTMFDHDRKTGGIRYIGDAPSLFAWIQEKSGHPKRWGKFEQCVSQDELFSSLYCNATYYDMISGVPNWPKRSDVYYTHGELPQPTPDAQYFNGFTKFFNPATVQDAITMLAYFATPLYYRQRVGRPIFVVDAKNGQGTGKTKLAECLAMLYGGDDPITSSPFVVSQKEIESPQDFNRKIRELLTSTGRLKRICLIDNVVGYFSGAQLCSLSTMGEISGMAQYGHTSESRPNDLTFVVTVNSATLSRDMIDRSMFINLERPEHRMENWERKVGDFIRAHRLQIIADMIGLLEAGPKFDVSPFTRFESWEREVLATICGTMESFSEVAKQTMHRREMADGDVEDAHILEEYFYSQIKAFGIDPEETPIWLGGRVISRWAKDIKKDITERAASHVVRNMARGKMFTRLSEPFEEFQGNGIRCKGMYWNFHISEKPKYVINVGSNQTVEYTINE